MSPPHDRPRSRSYPEASVRRPGPRDYRLHKSEPPHPPLPPPLVSTSHHSLFEDDIDDDPGQHFLSPVYMYEYEDWADDSGDEESSDEIEWNAGITDFALFDSDRRRARERHEDVPDRWGNLIASQATALQRAVERNRADSDPSRHRTWTPLLEDVPQLTPDNSPSMHDMDPEAFKKAARNAHLSAAQRPSIARSIEVEDSDSIMPHPLSNMKSGEEDSAIEDDQHVDTNDTDESDLSFFFSDASASPQHRLRQFHLLERPGLRYNRTMSGKVHVWRRPSFNIYTVGEDADAEREAEKAPENDKAPASDL